MMLHQSLVFFFFLFLSCLALSSWALPLCSDSSEFLFVCLLSAYGFCCRFNAMVNFLCVVFSGAPLKVNSTLSFCPYKGKTCCDSMEDSNLKKQFQAMNISDKGCASVVKSILCAVSNKICL